MTLLARKMPLVATVLRNTGENANGPLQVVFLIAASNQRGR